MSHSIRYKISVYGVDVYTDWPTFRNWSVDSLVTLREWWEHVKANSKHLHKSQVEVRDQLPIFKL